MIRPKSAVAKPNNQFIVNKEDFLLIQTEFPKLPLEVELLKDGRTAYSLRINREAYTYLSLSPDTDIYQREYELPAPPVVYEHSLIVDKRRVDLAAKVEDMKLSEEAKEIIKAE